MTGWELRRLREALDLSIARLAREMGTARPHLSQVETGRRRLTPEFEQRALSALRRVQHRRSQVFPPAWRGRDAASPDR